MKLRNSAWTHQIYATKYQSEVFSENPKLYLAHNQSYINTLFLLLSKETTSYVDPVWNLLTTLPPNKKMQSDIETLNIPDTTSVFPASFNIVE